MPYSRDEVVAEITSFYEFLVRLYLPPDSIKRPPPEGWPQITSERLEWLDKDETVVDLLKHLPYVRNDNNHPFKIYEGCACNDYTGRYYERAMKTGDKGRLNPYNTESSEKKEDRLMPHMVTLARAAPPRDGYYIFCDTKRGTLELVDFMDGKYHERGTKELFQMLKADFRTLKVIPVQPEEVKMAFRCDEDMMTALKEVYIKHGWLSKWFRKDECAAEVKRVWDSFFQ